ncbi:hypothetical protein INR49_021885 [Caranx melampygus]|nr:hypothetical protein INR49_021885 [Caranx melampygus]
MWSWTGEKKRRECDENQVLEGAAACCEMQGLTCAYSPEPGRRPVGPGRALAAGSDTAPRISTFLFFLALTFWLSSLSSSGRLVVLRERGRPEEKTEKGAMRLSDSLLSQCLLFVDPNVEEDRLNT